MNLNGSDVQYGEEMYDKIQKAYDILCNNVTKLIYDKYGIPGLIMYKNQETKFESLVEELRVLNAEPPDNTDLFKAKKLELEFKILRKSQILLKNLVSEHEAAYYQRSITIDLGLNAKAFCNYYAMFYYHEGHFKQIHKLLKYKTMSTNFNVQIPFSDTH